MQVGEKLYHYRFGSMSIVEVFNNFVYCKFDNYYSTNSKGKLVQDLNKHMFSLSSIGETIFTSNEAIKKFIKKAKRNYGIVTTKNKNMGIVNIQSIDLSLIHPFYKV